MHAGLREHVFGLQAPASRRRPRRRREPLVTVLENPIPPELAVFRRSISAATPALVAGLAEEVLDALTDHAIFYCLTVKEVVALHAQLREYLGDGGRVRVRRFHGGLTEAEKSAVLTEFREAPKRGEEGFVPLIVVATSAFGLGINRADIRTVFWVTPPTDLAALYQQLGRAGRDGPVLPPGADLDAAEPGRRQETNPPPQRQAPTRAGADDQSRTADRAVHDGQGCDPGLLNRMAQAVLAACTVSGAGRVADGSSARTSAADAHPGEARATRTVEEYTAGVVRAFAALAGLGAVETSVTSPRWPR